MFGYVYETTNLVNGKTYIGKRTGEFDSNYYGSGTILKQALRKYGRENFIVKVLGTYETEEDLNAAEIMLIESLNPSYNIAKGGTGGNTLARASDERKTNAIRKRTETMIDIYSNLSVEKRQKWNKTISDAKKGKTPNRLNYHHSEEVKERIRETNKISATKRPDSWKTAHALSAQRRRGITNIHSQTPVEVNGVIYDGVMVAAKELDVTRQTIKNWINKGKARYV